MLNPTSDEVFIGGKLRRRPSLNKVDKTLLQLRTVKSAVPWLHYNPLSPVTLTGTSRSNNTTDPILPVTTAALNTIGLYNSLTFGRPSAFSAIANNPGVERLMQLSPLTALGLHSLKSNIRGLSPGVLRLDK
eukprot:sb/3474943/